MAGSHALPSIAQGIPSLSRRKAGELRLLGNPGCGPFSCLMLAAGWPRRDTTFLHFISLSAGAKVLSSTGIPEGILQRKMLTPFSHPVPPLLYAFIVMLTDALKYVNYYCYFQFYLVGVICSQTSEHGRFTLLCVHVEKQRELLLFFFFFL